MKYIKVRVTADSKNDKVEKKDNSTYLISVREKAKNNQANNKVIELISSELGVPSKKIQIVNGHHHPSKLIKINDK